MQLPLLARAEGFEWRVTLVAPEGLRDRLEAALDIVRWQGDARMNLSLLRIAHAKASEQMTRVLESEGYYQAKIKAELREDAKPIEAHYQIETGKQSLVSAVQLNFGGPLGENDAAAEQRRNSLTAAWKLPVGQAFRHEDWEAAKRALLNGVSAVSYATAKITASRAEVDDQQHSVRLEVTVDSGPAWYFGEISTQGLKRYPPTTVLRLAPMQRGDRYDLARLLQYQSLLQDSGWFSHAEVVAVTEGADPAAMPLHVSIREAATKTVSLGIGASSDSGLRGQLSRSNRNFLGSAMQLDTRLQLDRKQQSLSADLRLPLDEKARRDSFGVRAQRSNIGREVIQTLGLRARRAWGDEQIEHALVAEYLSEVQKLPEAADADHSSALFFGYEMSLRRSDSAIYPHRGYHLQAHLGGAPLAVTTDQTFLRAWARYSHYLPLSQRGTLIGRVEAGKVVSKKRDGIPADYLFRAGGDQSVRGHSYRSIGVGDAGAVVGGLSMTTASLEYRHWLGEDWGAAIFADAGRVADNFAKGQLATGIGFGARWNSPVGPLNLDIARGASAGIPGGHWRLHFSVGIQL